MDRDTEKILVGIPAETLTSLKKDAEQFEIYKKNGPEINFNGFLGRLLVGYYTRYKQEIAEKKDRIRELVGPLLGDREKTEEIAERLMEKMILPSFPRRKGKHSERLSLKPTRETGWIIDMIRDSTGNSDVSCSQYLGRLFVNYSEKPFHERERIVFRENADFLVNACRERRSIVFSTTRTPGLIHHVIPYELVVHAEEMNNYLLCEEYNRRTGKNEAATYRLCRILRPHDDDVSGTPDPAVIVYLERMKKQGPQWAIREDREICVRFTAAGRVSYRQIYVGRPAVDRVEELDNGEALYYFNASEEQVFRFVIRFTPGQAEILSPPELRARIRRHYRTAAALYEER